MKCPKCGVPYLARPTFDGQQGDTARTAASPDEDPFPTLPAEFGRYRVLRLLGRGGMGAVYLAEDSQLGRLVALKIPFFDAKSSPQRLERFTREARSAAGLHHPNLCTVFDAGEVGGRPFLTTRYVKGTSLEAEIERADGVSQARAAEVTRQVALALEFAHRAGIVHRDLKPANVMVAADGEPVVMDFGLAKLIADADPNEAKLTRDGGVIGTPSYMSPEQIRGDAAAIGPASDIYSLGVMLFELLTAETPYRGSAAVVMGQTLAAPVRSVWELRPDADPRLEAACRKAMAKDPAARFASMAAFAAALDAYLKAPDAPAPPNEITVTFDQLVGTPAPARAKPKRRRLAGVALAVALVLAAAGAAAAVVLRLETKGGTLLVEIDDPEVEARLKGGTLTLCGPDGKVRYTLSAGERDKKLPAGPYTLRVEGADGLTLDTPEFTLKRGEKVTVKVSLERKEPAKKADAARASPPDALRREDLTPEDLAAAGGGDPKQAPASLVGVLGEVLPHHAAAILALAYSPDGKWLASGGADQTVHLRDASTGDTKRVLAGHTGPVVAVAFSKDSKSVVSASHDGTLKLWPVETAGEPKTVPADIGAILSMAASPDGRFVAAAGKGRAIKLWAWGQWDQPSTITAPQAMVRALAISPDGNLLAAASGEGKESCVGISLTSDGSLKKTWLVPPGATPYVVGLGFHRDGKWLAGVADGVRLWDIEAGKEVAYAGGSGSFNCLAMHPDGKTVYGCEMGGVGGWLYDVSTLKRAVDLGRVEVKHFREPQGIQCAVFSPLGNFLAFGSGNGSLHVWDFARNEKQLPQRRHSHYASLVSVGPDGRSVLTGGDDNSVRQWDITRPRDGKLMVKTDFTLSHVSSSPDGTRYVTSARFWDHLSDTGVVWDAASNRRLFDVEPPASTYQVVFSPDGKSLATCAQEGSDCVVLWDAKTGKQVHRFPKFGRCEDRPAFSRDGRLVAAASIDTKLAKVWDVRSGAEVASWGDEKPMCAVALTPDGTSVAAGHPDGSISLWAVAEKGKKVRVWEGHSGAIRRLMFTPDGRTLVSAGSDGTLRLWDPETPRAREVIPVGPAKGLLTFDLDPSGKYLFVAGQSPLIFILRLPDAEKSVVALREPVPAAADPDRRAAVYVLSLGGVVRVNDEAREISAVAGLPKEAFRLTFAFADSSAADDKGFEAFRSCKNLAFLQFRCQNVGDIGFSNFASCTGLTNVELYHTQITSDGLASFAKAEGLKILILNDCKRIGDAGMAHFKGMKELMKLEFSGTQVTDAGLACFKDCQRMKELRLEDTPMGDAGLTHFRGCVALERLHLDGTKVTDAALATLKGFPKLADLRVSRTPMTAKGVAALRAALPGCKISGDGLAAPAAPAPKAAADPFPKDSVWVRDAPALSLTVTERVGETFRARFVLGGAIERDVSGVVKDGKVKWLARDVKLVKGGPGGDNEGTLARDPTGDVLNFTYQQGTQSGVFTLRRVPPK